MEREAMPTSFRHMHTLYLFFNSKAEQVDGEALLCMNEETLKTLVPPAGVRAKLLHKIKKT